jgi:hypothetical protein
MFQIKTVKEKNEHILCPVYFSVVSHAATNKNIVTTNNNNLYSERPSFKIYQFRVHILLDLLMNITLKIGNISFSTQCVILHRMENNF